MVFVAQNCKNLRMTRSQWNKEEKEGNERKGKRCYSVSYYKEKTKGRYRCRDYEFKRTLPKCLIRKTIICLSVTTNASESSKDTEESEGQW